MPAAEAPGATGEPALTPPSGLPGSEPDRKPLLRRVGGAMVVLGVVLVNWGGKAKALLLLLPKLKVLTTSGTMLVSVAAYSLIWGWKFALGFVLLLLVHEMGHVIQLRREGIEASAPVFIPFLGAAVWSKSLGNDATAEARVGLAGPILGSLGAAALLPLAGQDDFWQALAFTGFFLNLFNLLPVLPLDGGRAMAAMSPKMWFVGFAGLLALTFAFPNPVMIIILLLGGMETWRRWRMRRSGDEGEQAYYRVRPRDRLLVAAVYVGLIALLALGMAETHLERDFDDV